MMTRVLRRVGLPGVLCPCVLCVCVLGLCVLMSDVSASASAPRFALMETGNFPGFLDDRGGDIAPPSPGELWLGLFPTRQGYELRPARLVVSVTSEVAGNGTNKPPRTMTVIAVRGPRQPIFLLKTGGRLSPGPVPTAFAGELFLEPDKFVRLRLADRDYLLDVKPTSSASSASSTTSSEEGSPVSLTLEGQPFFEGQLYRDHPTWHLIWAGDLDRDGKLDLYLELGGDVGVNRRLFLSSAAKKNEPIGLAASFSTLGC